MSALLVLERRLYLRRPACDILGGATRDYKVQAPKVKIIDPAVFKKFESQFQFNPRVNEKIAYSSISDILKAIDGASGTIVEGANTNTGKLEGHEPKQLVENFATETQAAIGSLQNIFGKPGISIALCAEDHRYKDGPPEPPRAPELLQHARNEVDQYNLKHPNAPFSLKNYYKDDNPDFWRNDLKPKIKQLEENSQAFLEDQRYYAVSLKDYARATQLVQLAGGGVQIAPDLIILERGMKYATSGNTQKTVKEEELIGTALTIKQRSAVIAAYLFLCAAGGERGGNFRVLVFIGEEHKDVFDRFEELVGESKTFPWVKGVKRHYGIIPSHVVK